MVIKYREFSRNQKKRKINNPKLKKLKFKALEDLKS
jgi:hypothetical protein